MQEGQGTFSEKANVRVTLHGLCADLLPIETNSGLSSFRDCAQGVCTVPLNSASHTFSFSPLSQAAVQCATSMAMSSLRLLESSVSVNIPGPKTAANHGQLQLRIALHSGSIHAGVVGVTQHSTGLPPDQLQHATPVPRLHVFGNTYSEALKLRDTSLALQIRVSQRFRELILASHSKFVLEQCPDFQSSTGGAASSALQHTYWLVGTEDTDVGLPPLDRAVSLGNYDDL
eukprot:scpid96810/ scgid3751/ 